MNRFDEKLLFENGKPTLIHSCKTESKNKCQQNNWQGSGNRRFGC